MFDSYEEYDILYYLGRPLVIDEKFKNGRHFSYRVTMLDDHSSKTLEFSDYEEGKLSNDPNPAMLAAYYVDNDPHVFELERKIREQQRELREYKRKARRVRAMKRLGLV